MADQRRPRGAGRPQKRSPGRWKAHLNRRSTGKPILMLGFALSDERFKALIEGDHYPQIQTHRFNWLLIKALENTRPHQIAYLSNAPITDYPSNPNLFVRGEASQEIDLGLEGKAPIRELSFVNHGVLKMATRVIAAAVSGLTWSITTAEKTAVITYSVHIPYLLVGTALSKLNSIPHIAIWTDPPGQPSEREQPWKRILRLPERRLARKLMNGFDRAITLAPALVEDFAPAVHYMVMDGLLETEASNSGLTADNGSKPVFVYTGALREDYGLRSLVEAFKTIEPAAATLRIYGAGPAREMIVEASNRFDNIEFGGFVSHEDAIEAQKCADFVINPRPTDNAFAKYSFPSKVLEYLASGAIPLLTITPGMSQEYGSACIPIETDDPCGIRQALNRALSLTPHERRVLRTKAHQIAQSRHYLHQGKRIWRFVDEAGSHDK